ncbi:phosphoribosylaminoimidazole-succinocarboxamide synthase [Thioalkalivibrio sulfidiphilus HL-EbGr7]|uniref:Phosphoribosylaminoimidazole-succinocarboxamide synthase n=1 Tax=Thioalkalivibrio sulfidiphilus (strain HL-EbGR7) TaxID=396588 RepID=PUR7_THISH|nr:phosphoribosylaminoimidazolesuccinocarboxamide synthase [Thioalkalivibrio sulfidiphilus]B8GP39.1 RecName: Full=Phosphoribosylaminoimidazole-succinocarboxamide synthase; AltName: Full=SAICAR synthetase [Thioalkalivibrio sulfidiphilus HL-EbGr7]ACL73959.1 phosphoribosylaminoimidazole-succinocarboxamide synthase [Thioalkalivibrio sulfidiphilus HL-EbGr7]
MSQPLLQSHLTSLPLIHRGKVRDLYAVGDDHLLIVTTDRVSAFDVILPTPIPGKGEVLTKISEFWFRKLEHIVPNQLADMSLAEAVPDAAERAPLEGRSLVVKRLKALPIEAVVRGYLIGSGWKDYQKTGQVCGNPLPAGLQLADRLPEPIYTPSTKAAVGDHDENVDFDYTAELVGPELAAQVRQTALALYKAAAEYALARGIIIADTKFEFGLDDEGVLHLIDEALTPDSSRFWPADTYRPGISPPSFDKQFVRDYLETLDWNKQAPGPELPPDVVQKTTEKYREALLRLTGAS